MKVIKDLDTDELIWGVGHRSGGVGGAGNKYQRLEGWNFGFQNCLYGCVANRARGRWGCFGSGV